MFFVVKIEMMVVCSTFLFLWRGTSTWQTCILLVEKAQYLHLRLFFPTKSSEFVDIRDETNDAENGEVFLDWRLEIWCSWSRWPKISERKTSLISKSSKCSIKQKYLVELLSSSNFPSPFLHGKKKEKETKMVRIAQVDFLKKWWPSNGLLDPKISQGSWKWDPFFGGRSKVDAKRCGGHFGATFSPKKNAWSFGLVSFLRKSPSNYHVLP